MATVRVYSTFVAEKGYHQNKHKNVSTQRPLSAVLARPETQLS